MKSKFQTYYIISPSESQVFDKKIRILKFLQNFKINLI